MEEVCVACGRDLVMLTGPAKDIGFVITHHVSPLYVFVMIYWAAINKGQMLII